MKIPGLIVEVSGGGAWIVAGITSISLSAPVEFEAMTSYIYGAHRIRS
jgi:hypothetical protein